MKRRAGIRWYLFVTAALGIAFGLGVVAFTVQRVAEHQLVTFSHNRDLAIARNIAVVLEGEYARGGARALALQAQRYADLWQTPLVVSAPAAAGLQRTFTPSTPAASSEVPVSVNLPLTRLGRTIHAHLTLTHPPSFTPHLSPVIQAIEGALKWASVVGFLAALLLSLLVGERLVAPLRHLAQGVHRLARGQLDHRVTARGPKELVALGEDFNAMATALESAEVARQQLIADIAHELRTPLSVLLGYLEAIRDGVPLTEPEPLAVAARHARYVTDLVQDLQELALADAKVLPLHLEVLNPVPLVRELVEEFQWQAEQKQVALGLQVSGTLPAIRADGRRFRQAMGNLVGNAIHYVSSGGRVTVIAESRAAVVHFEVRDNGPGIPEADQQHVFNRFYRLDPARSRHTGGVGLGLAIAKHLVELQGGSIGVVSTVGEGSTFWIDWPVA